MAVKVVKVDSLTMFWVQLKTGSEDFQDLLEELTRRIIRREHMLRHRPDHVVVIELVIIRENREWQRGIITTETERSRSLYETGAVTWNAEVYILEDKF